MPRLLKRSIKQFRHQATDFFGSVVSLGDLCYSRADMNEFEDWCEPGDIVTFSKYSGVRFHVHGHPIRILNDDEIQAIIKDRDSVSW